MLDIFKIFLLVFLIPSCAVNYSAGVEHISQDELNGLSFNYPDFKKDGWEYREIDIKDWKRFYNEDCKSNIADIIKDHNLENIIKALSYGICFRDTKSGFDIYALFPDVGTTHTQFIYVRSDNGEQIERYLLNTYE